MFLLLHKVIDRYTSKCIEDAYENWQVHILDRKLTFHAGGGRERGCDCNTLKYNNTLEEWYTLIHSASPGYGEIRATWWIKIQPTLVWFSLAYWQTPDKVHKKLIVITIILGTSQTEFVFCNLVHSSFCPFSKKTCRAWQGDWHKNNTRHLEPVSYCSCNT